MRKLIRILAGALMVAAVISPGSAAWANHHDPAPPAGTAGPVPGATGHEEMPNLAVATPEEACIVSGKVDPGVTTTNTFHGISIPLVNANPSHSHYRFIDSVIDCPAALGGVGPLDVLSGGGNDGHMLDIVGNNGGIDCGGNGQCLEADPVYPGPKDDKEHEFNNHHGSVNESAWSNSSGYTTSQTVPNPVPNGPPLPKPLNFADKSNECDDGIGDRNKANITATDADGNVARGWVKYIRVGVVVHAWGCFNSGDVPDGRRMFSAELLILPDVSPVAVAPFLPGGATPLCVTNSFPDPGSLADDPCGFVLAGTAVRGSTWLRDCEKPQPQSNVLDCAVNGF